MKTLKRILLALPGFQALCRRLTRHVPRVLMYHRFAAPGERAGRRLPAAVLERQLRYLARHHRCWHPDDYSRWLAGAASPDGCPVLLTIDDGYADAVTVAAPLLSRHGMTALLFATSGFVDGETWFWWDRLRWLLEAAWPVTAVPLAGRTYRATGTDPAARERLWNDLADALQPLPAADRDAELAALASRLGTPLPARPPAGAAPATWDQLRTLDGGPLLIGAHTVTHPVLSREDDATVRAELTGGKQRLEEMLGRPVTRFCYPSGMPADLDDRVVRLVAATGYREAFVAHPGGDPADPYRQPRHGVPADWTEFRWLLCGAGLWRRAIRRSLSRREERA